MLWPTLIAQPVVSMSDVCLTQSAHKQLLAESQTSLDGNETGGILLGYDLGMGSGFSIQHCGDPGPDAVRGPALFHRDLEHARTVAERAARVDGSAWIGEWHTHLLELSAPSDHDLTTYSALLIDTEIRFPRLLSLIVLPNSDGSWLTPRIFAWSITLTSMRPLSLSVDGGT